MTFQEWNDLSDDKRMEAYFAPAAELAASLQAEENAFRNRDSAVAENDKLRAELATLKPRERRLYDDFSKATDRIRALEAALAQIAEDESISRSEMVAIASEALGSELETGAERG